MRRSLAALALLAAGTAHAAAVSIYTDLATWQAALTGAVQTQDFSGYAAGTSLFGETLLPGMSLTSNTQRLEVFGVDPAAFALGGRDNGNVYYEAQYALPYRAVALDIGSFESIPGNSSTAVDTGQLLFTFSDGSTELLEIAGNATGASIFVGVVADRAITGFRWTEAHEGSGGNEETTLDNLRVALRGDGNTVPLPGTLPLAALALGLLALGRRRR
ncbi:hypothetical protein NYO99_08255 [Pelomonas sp. UHG3]|uniref:Uncharacterized protein n=1 Tax=Roseateles hydrophilus TaxID=2975054 RepID=A0ACC6C9B0_9BURK|nr:PEP-CTERM sorting domain-containing protein [Pelomonas sp. UHG3]MCY4744960.1 hypothetical protein [Pelomonas sp. UHG3]